MDKLTVGDLSAGTLFVVDGMVYVHNGGILDDGRSDVMIIGKVVEHDSFQFSTLANDDVVTLAMTFDALPVPG